MASGPPSFLIREARPRDHRALLGLARELDSINLPSEPAQLRALIVRSAQSFRRRIRDRARAAYLFCAEELQSKRIVAASMIIGKHGTPASPHYYLEIDSDERYSHTLRKMFRHSYLRLRYSMDGPTEIGGLIGERAMRGHPEQIGKQISWVRFLYLARHPRKFERRVIAEVLPPLNPDHGNPFWDHYGRPVTGLSFREADHLSTRDKEFIRTLFPESPLYTFLLPEEVRNSLGVAGEQTRGAVRLLEQAGMRFLNQIDPFDGGPYYGAQIAELVPVREYCRLRARTGRPGGSARNVLLAHDHRVRGFRAVRAGAAVDGDTIVVEPGTLEALGVTERTRLDVVFLP